MLGQPALDQLVDRETLAPQMGGERVPPRRRVADPEVLGRRLIEAALGQEFAGQPRLRGAQLLLVERGGFFVGLDVAHALAGLAVDRRRCRPRTSA